MRHKDKEERKLSEETEEGLEYIREILRKERMQGMRQALACCMIEAPDALKPGARVCQNAINDLIKNYNKRKTLWEMPCPPHGPFGEGGCCLSCGEYVGEKT